MSDNERIIEIINKDEKYKIFRDNDFIKPFLEGGFEFKDKKKTSVGFIKKENQEIVDRLIEIFKITDKQLFEEKFNEAVSGDGREENNMLTIWSSSLCALLFFYNISNKPITITLDNISYCFNEVHFEIQNKVLSIPSNIDVVLVDRINKCFLFLESKFAEYLNNDKNKTSSEYFSYLCKIKEAELANKMTDNDDSSIYHYGLKQFLTHYIGLDHFTNDEKYEYHENDKRHELFDFYHNNKSEFKIYLQEIVFNNDETRKNEYFNNLTQVSNILSWNNNVTIISPTTYQSFFEGYDLKNESIKSFYNIINK